MTDVKIMKPIVRDSVESKGSDHSTDYQSNISPSHQKDMKNILESDSEDSCDELDCTCGCMEQKLKEIFEFKASGSMSLEEANARILFLSAEVERVLSINVRLVKKVHLLMQMGGSAQRIAELELQVGLLIESNNKYAAMIENYKKQLAEFQAQLSGKKSASASGEKLGCVDKIDELTKNLTETKKQVVALEKAKEEIAQKSQASTKNYDDEIKKLRSDNTSLNLKMAILNKQNEDLLAKLKERDLTIGKLNSSIEILNTNNNNLMAELEKTRKERDDGKNTIKIIEGNNNELIKILGQRDATIKSNNATINELNIKITNFNIEIKNLNIIIEELRATIKSRDESIEKLNIQVNELKESNKQIITLKLQITSLTRERDNLIKERDDLKSQNGNLNKQISEANSKIEQLNKRIADLQKELEDLAGKNRSLIAILQERDKTIEELNKIIIELRRIRDNLTADLNKLQQEKDDLHENHTTTNKKVSAERDHLQGRVFEFGQKLEESEEQVKQSAFKIQEIGKEKDILSKLKEALHKENNQKAQNIEDLTKKVNDLTALLAAKEEALKKAESDIKGLNLIKNKLVKDIDNLQADKATLETNNKNLNIDVQNKDAIVKDLMFKNDELIKILKQRDQTIDNLNKEIEELKKNKIALTTTRDTLFNDNKNLAEQLQIKDKQLKAANDEISSWKIKYDDVSKQLASTKSELTIKIQLIEKLAKELEDAQEQIKNLQAANQQLATDNQTLTKEKRQLNLDITMKNKLIESLKKDIETKNRAYDELNVKYNELNTKHTDLNIQIAFLSKQHKALQDENAILKTQLADSQKANEDLTKKLAVVTADAQRFFNELQQKNEIMKKMQQDINDLDKKLKDLTAKYEDLEKKHSDCGKNEANLTLIINQLKIEIKNLTDIRIKYEITIQTLTKEKASLESQLKDAEDEIARLKKALAESNAQLNESHQRNLSLVEEIKKLNILVSEQSKKNEALIIEIQQLNASLDKINQRYTKLRSKTEKICHTMNISADLEEAKNWNSMIAEMQKKMESRIKELTTKANETTMVCTVALSEEPTK